jgi:hypothetical protein
MTSTKCIYCASERIVKDVKLYCDNSGNFQLSAKYPNPKKTIFRPYLSEFMYAEICSACGSMVRIYAKTPHDAWETG